VCRGGGLRGIRDWDGGEWEDVIARHTVKVEEGISSGADPECGREIGRQKRERLVVGRRAGGREKG
jgi:hypothetical protein